MLIRPNKNIYSFLVISTTYFTKAAIAKKSNSIIIIVVSDISNILIRQSWIQSLFCSNYFTHHDKFACWCVSGLIWTPLVACLCCQDVVVFRWFPWGCKTQSVILFTYRHLRDDTDHTNFNFSIFESYFKFWTDIKTCSLLF